jgi:hypothetical protein
MAYNSNDLIKMTLQELGVQQAGQPVAAEDAELLQERIPSVLGDLNARDVGFFDVTNIEDTDLLPLAQIMAYASYNAFTITDPTKISTLTAIGGKNGEAERTLRDVKRLRTPRQTMRCEQFARYRYGRYGW